MKHSSTFNALMPMPNSFLFQNVYKHDADEIRHQFSIMPDRPDFVHSREVSKNVSDVRGFICTALFLLDIYFA